MTPPVVDPGVAVLDRPGGVSPLEALFARGRLRGTLAMLGPAFVAAIAYVDPGNFATNLQGGAKYGYLLLWVVLAANLMAMLIQYLSAKLGVVTGHNLPELCRMHYPRWAAAGLWIQAEVMAMSTDIAEFLGAALGLNLLFHVPLLPAGFITGVVAFGILGLQRHGYRRFELAVTGLLGLIFLGFLYETLKIGPSASGTVHGLVPHLAGADSVYLAVGIVGATVMPHVVYLHSALQARRVDARTEAQRQTLLRYNRWDCIIGLGVAGLVNVSMLAVASALPGDRDQTGSGDLGLVHEVLSSRIGHAAGVAFALALVAAGLGSASVGTYAGQVVMQGFMGWRWRLTVRRLVTMLPSLVVLAVTSNVTAPLVFSQVALSFGIPFALIPMVLLTRRADVMGTMVNRRTTTVAIAAGTVVIVGLNIYLLMAL
jgi:manganese transport protein